MKVVKVKIQHQFKKKKIPMKKTKSIESNKRRCQSMMDQGMQLYTVDKNLCPSQCLNQNANLKPLLQTRNHPQVQQSHPSSSNGIMRLDQL